MENAVVIKFQNSTTPSFTADITYANWKEEINIWKDFTDIAEEKKGSAVFLSLQGQARETVRQNVSAAVLKTANGLKQVFACLDKIYLKDSTCQAYEAYEEFERFVRPADMKISDYIIKFEQLYNKAKNHQMTVSDGAVAYRLLNSAGLSENNKQLVRATVSEMKYETMKNQLTKVFTNTCSTANSEVNVKIESSDTFYNNCHTESYRSHHHYQHEDQTPNRTCDGSFCGFANGQQRGNTRGRYNRGFRGGRGGRRGRGGRGNSNVRSKRENVKDENGNVTKCFSCGSTEHWARECPKPYGGQVDTIDEKEESL